MGEERGGGGGGGRVIYHRGTEARRNTESSWQLQSSSGSTLYPVLDTLYQKLRILQLHFSTSPRLNSFHLDLLSRPTRQQPVHRSFRHGYVQLATGFEFRV
jgi:hypothetical protein